MKTSNNIVNYLKLDKTTPAFVDLGKIFAGFLAILLASLSFFKYYDWPIDSPNMVILTWFHVLGTACIPLFLISVGYACVNQKITFKYYYQLLYFLITYWLISGGLYLFNCWINHKSFIFTQYVIETFNYTISPYSWYIEIYIGLYLLVPLLNLLWQKTKVREEHVLILIVFFTLSCLPSMTNVYNKIFPTYYEQLYPLFYYLVGAYLRTDIEKQIREKSYLKRGWLIVIVISLISLAQNIAILYDVKFEERIFNQFFSWPACFIAIGLIFMLKNWKLPQWLIKMNRYISKCIIWAVLGSAVFAMPIYTWLNQKIAIYNLNAGIILGVTIIIFISSCFICGGIYYCILKLISIKK